MRYLTLCALLATTTALSGCVGGDGSALSLATNGVSVCGISQPNCATPSTPVTPVTPVTPGSPVTPPPPPPNVGNTATFTTGDATIALENSVLVSTKAAPAVSKLTLVAGSPNTAKLEINTNTANNSLWPIAKTMEEYAYGTNASGGVGLGGAYNEYRSLSTTAAGSAQDEELQVWSWGNSYATQYRDVTSGGGAASHQAWSFGGTKTTQAAMPIAGSGDYYGQFGATAKTSNWVDSTDPLQTVSHNNIWRIQGGSELTANFGTGNFTGTLTPQLWNAFATMNGAVGFTTIDLSVAPTANHAGFMYSTVGLKGTITTNATTGNSITGTAVADPNDGWLTNTTTNPMYAGVFGAGANEITGAFAFEATAPGPLGGNLPINDDRRGFLSMSGVFHGQ